MALKTADEILTALLPEWHQRLQQWAMDGCLSDAAREALLLNEEPEALRDLVTQWSSGNFGSLPPIALLSSADINGAMGAYAISTGAIYLNADWLVGASKDQINAVLTEELGHHMDRLINAVDTPGDEGEHFSYQLLAGKPTAKETDRYRREKDYSTADIGGKIIRTETALDPGFTYSLSDGASLNASSFDEGKKIYAKFTLTDFQAGSPVYWKIRGIYGTTGYDFLDQNGNPGSPEIETNITGETTIDSTGVGNITIDIFADGLTEGDEPLQIFIYSDPARADMLAYSNNFTIKDTSKSQAAIRSESLYLITPTDGWNEGEAYAQANGGHLATINNVAENQWLHDTFINQMFLGSGFATYYIGYNDQQNEGTWVWADQSNTTFSNWHSGEPNAGQAFEDYAVIAPNYWGINSSGPLWGDANALSGSIAEIPLTSSITFSTTPKEGAGVFTTSINLSAGTSESGNLAEGATVYWKVTGVDADDLASGQLSGSGTISSGKLDLQHSLKRDSDTGESFEIAVYSDAETTQQIGSTVSGSVLEGPKVVARGNSLYVVVDGPSWTEALVNAQSLGGTLAVIEDEAENTFLTASYKRDQLLFVDGAIYDDYVAWIGLTYDFETEEWRNADGQPQTYFNWNPSFLDARDPTYGQVNTSIILSSTSPYVVEDGVWDDSSENQDVPYLRNGIAEIPFIQRGDSAYVIVEGPTWEEAEANAQALGGHLVTINDAAEEQFLLNNTEGGWIGYTDKLIEGQWNWVDGTPKGYERWDPNNPSNNNEVEHYAYLDVGAYFGWGAGWNDVANNSNMTGIAEIKLSDLELYTTTSNSDTTPRLSSQPPPQATN